MTNTGSQIIKAIEMAWRTIQRKHPEIPTVVAVTGSGFHGKNPKWAHFWPGRWLTDNEEGKTPTVVDELLSGAPELFVSGELLGLPGRRIMQTLLHEAAHGLNCARKEHGTNINGRHNRVFVKAANELGLIWPEGKEPHKSIGFSQVEITDETAKKYEKIIEKLEAARLAYLADGRRFENGQGIGTKGNGGDGGEGGDGGTQKRGRGSRGGSRGGKRIYVTCICATADPFPITPGRLERAPILCGNCMTPFRPRDEDDD
ncbi:hypothetical protein ATK36_3178 [Amycolatopsis sulphurea]|uniref:SprT-like family protein n=1 Tax=Amycolatopsis sulphurea TaxID=76022 RepID=A0A2A9F9R8_9PSEU|nr:hypothetical protein [Amycolatopsis sulphurea]PFG48104.1 hypothetical protein ATK36_3178 [Amycolatopsis sulphurea]